jgi:hypothetical protein
MANWTFFKPAIVALAAKVHKIVTLTFRVAANFTGVSTPSTFKNLPKPESIGA